MFLKQIIGYAEQYVLARRCVKSRFGGVGIGWVIPYTYFVMARGELWYNAIKRSESRASTETDRRREITSKGRVGIARYR